MTTTRRDRWAYYAGAAMAGTAGKPTPYECLAAAADALIEEEERRFGKPDDDTSDLHAALATARAHALEQETRAANAEMALKVVRAQLAMSVPVAELNALNDKYGADEYDESDVVDAVFKLALAAEQRAAAPTAVVPAVAEVERLTRVIDRVKALLPAGGGHVAAYKLEHALFGDAAEQRAAATKPAEGGETGGFALPGILEKGRWSP